MLFKLQEAGQCVSLSILQLLLLRFPLGCEDGDEGRWWLVTLQLVQQLRGAAGIL